MIETLSQAPILTIFSTMATWDWMVELIVSLTDYDQRAWQRTSLCNYYGFILVGHRFWTPAPVFFGLVEWTVAAMALEDMRWRTTRNDMTFLIHSFGKV